MQKLSRQGSLVDISLSNPYEGLARFMSDSETKPRIIDYEELTDLRAMYDDFLELSTRYDDLIVERDRIVISIEDKFLTFPDLVKQSNINNLEDDESRQKNVDILFEIIKNKYMLNNEGKNKYSTFTGPRSETIDSLKHKTEEQENGIIFIFKY